MPTRITATIMMGIKAIKISDRTTSLRMASTTPPIKSIGMVATVPASMEAIQDTVSTS